MTICDITLIEEQVSRSELVAINPVTSLVFSRNLSKLFAGTMGMISRIDLVDVHKSVNTMKLDDWESSAVKDMCSFET